MSDNLLDWQPLPRQGADILKDALELAGSLSSTDFGGQQLAHRSRFEQPVGFRIADEVFRQVEVDSNTHVANNMTITSPDCQMGTGPEG